MPEEINAQKPRILSITWWTLSIFLWRR